MKALIESISNFVFPYRYLQQPEFQVSRNLLMWDRMIRNLN